MADASVRLTGMSFNCEGKKLLSDKTDYQVIKTNKQTETQKTLMLGEMLNIRCDYCPGG